MTPKPHSPTKPTLQLATLAEAYEQLIARGALKADSGQQQVLARLEQLRAELKTYKPRASGLFSKAKAPPQSVYIWGNVGRGKSMLMDLFFSLAPVAEEQKKRVHFHRFMQDVHARIHTIRQQTQKSRSGADPVVTLAQEIVAETRLLCFDELQATDVADASLLFRLFEALFAGGVIIVATSNHPPKTLYTGGVQRERFDKFVALLHEKMDVEALSSPTDYRTQQLRALKRTYAYPLNADARLFVQHTLEQLAQGEKPQRTTLSVHGRDVSITTYGDSTARATFAELCEATLGPADYLAIAERFDTLILTDIPQLNPEKRNEAKRFVTLIDALYENKVKLIATAATGPDRLYPEGDGSFEFQRTVSRLLEMQSGKWLGG